MIEGFIETEADLPPLSDAEIKRRADHILYLESTGMPLNEAISEGDQMIAIRRAFGYGITGEST